jgi:hypothetical protein
MRPFNCLRAIIALVVGLSASPINAGSAAQIPVPVDLWTTGDDGLTLRLRDALEGAFKSAPDFSLRAGEEGALVVRIPKNVDWKRVGGRIKVLYTVTFATKENTPIRGGRGSCWEDALEQCAAQIIKDARRAARKLR